MGAREDAERRLRLGRLAASRGAADAARDHWTAGLRLAPADGPLVRDLALELSALAERDGDRAAADRYLNAAAAADPAGPLPLLALAGRAARSGDHVVSRRLARMAAARLPPGPDGGDGAVTPGGRGFILDLHHGTRPKPGRRTPDCWKALWSTGNASTGNAATGSVTGTRSRSWDGSTTGPGTR